MSFFVEILVELVVQLVAELLAAMGIHRLVANILSSHPVLTLVAYAISGAGLGALSCVFLHQRLFEHGTLAYANLILVPVLVGFGYGVVRTWRCDQNIKRITLYTFLCGYLFALAFAISRSWVVMSG